jgi:hypothetical protein
MLEKNYFHHVMKDHQFKNEGLFYRFLDHEKDRGHTEDAESWHSVLLDLDGVKIRTIEEFAEKVGDKSDYHLKNPVHFPELLIDEHNCDLMDSVHPIKWVDPIVDVRQMLISRENMT